MNLCIFCNPEDTIRKNERRFYYEHGKEGLQEICRRARAVIANFEELHLGVFYRRIDLRYRPMSCFFI